MNNMCGIDIIMAQVVSPFQGLFNTNYLTQGFVLLHPELLHSGALPLEITQHLKISFG